MKAPVRSLKYVATAHPDEHARRVAELILRHGDDPWELVERIVEWADPGGCIHGELCEECWL
jgi:hypothetical protein